MYEFKNVSKTADCEYLYHTLTHNELSLIDGVLAAYFDGKIDFTETRLENGEPDFSAECKLIVNDDSYKETGYELLIMKWVEDREDTEHLVDCIGKRMKKRDWRERMFNSFTRRRTL